MCLPLGCLKFIVGVGSVLSIAISLGLLALTVYINVVNKKIINTAGNELLTNSLLAIYLASAVFMILGICGVYGAMKTRKKQKNSGKCFLFFYLIGVFIFFSIFAAGTIFFFVGPHYVLSNQCTHGSKGTLVKELSDLSDKAKEFCTSNCPCLITNQTSYLYNYLLANKEGFVSNSSGFLTYKSCLPQEQQNSTNSLFLNGLQQIFECGGWCENNVTQNYYKFSDINKCVDEVCFTKIKTGCYQAFSNFLYQNGDLMGAGCGIATAICLINVITVLCICCHPSQKKRGSNFYARMMDQD